MQKTLTALQPSGILHLGNYFGAIEPFVQTQSEGDNFLFIVDYHAITTPFDPKELRKNILFATATYLAAGVDPEKTVLFQQSRVLQHTELAWILNCIARMGELERMVQFKDKSRNKGESVSVGLFSYPVLMAADILLYDTDIVPVGEDQKQHVELARDLAKRFNRDFGDTFTIPEPRIREHGARIMGLNDPTSKMSKSAESAKNYISLMDEDEVVRKKIMSAVTDSEPGIIFDPENRKGLANLMTIMSLVTKTTTEQIQLDYTGKGFGDFKKDLAEAVILWLKPLRAKIEGHLQNEDILIDILNKGAERANEIAERKMKLVREKIGISL